MMESIEKLRELAADINASEIVDHMKLYPSCVFDGAWLDAWHNEFYRVIDMLEAEIAERFMELPVDADGVPIRVGDELYNGEVIAFGGLAEGGVVFVHRGFEDGNYILEAFASNVTHHIKQRTVEDVLREFAYKVCDLNVADCDVERYAEELRSMGVVE